MEDQEKEKEKEPSMAEQTQAAKHELLQEMQALSLAIGNLRWTASEGKQAQLLLEEMYRRVVNNMSEECGLLLDSAPDAVIAQTLQSPSSRGELAEGEVAAGEVLMLAEVAGKDRSGRCAMFESFFR